MQSFTMVPKLPRNPAILCTAYSQLLRKTLYLRSMRDSVSVTLVCPPSMAGYPKSGTNTH